jgi:hypothetical protein
MEEMVKDHIKDVDEFRTASQQVEDPDLNAWAKKTLPVPAGFAVVTKDDLVAGRGEQTGGIGGTHGGALQGADPLRLQRLQEGVIGSGD